MCVCAPYSSLEKYRYKVKLVPGGMRRSSTIKVARDMLARQALQRARGQAARGGGALSEHAGAEEGE
eukprot:CAMPEP_0177731530 /NCGR_PEP_ID=MMETSP0484_2-20121128/22606_1 /TAXON_ID=354590 /ORGANISM="Rhodomonas lens, Strain RHODO" /LENGTH=66 /DNA_ID=CAMNT_0019244661 /DNA_START=52 /DNA_END=249 /DNA_ORIENTATION=-